jgi:hypothetical protein
MLLPPTVWLNRAEPPAVKAVMLPVGSRRSGGEGSDNKSDSMLGCVFPMLFVVAYCRNNTKAKT